MGPVTVVNAWWIYLISYPVMKYPPTLVSALFGSHIRTFGKIFVIVFYSLLNGFSYDVR